MMTNATATTTTVKFIKSMRAHIRHPECPADIKRSLTVRVEQLERRLLEQLRNDSVRARLNRGTR